MLLQVDIDAERKTINVEGITDCDTKDGEKFDEMIGVRLNTCTSKYPPMHHQDSS